MSRPASLALLLLVSFAAGCPMAPARQEADGPAFLTETLPSGTVGVPYEVTLAAHGGTAPRVFGIPSVPPGFSFYPATGVLTGTPRETGTFPLTFTVTDAEGRTDRRDFTLVIHNAGSDGGDDGPDGGGEPDPDGGEEPPPAEDALLRVVNWNVEWFGHTGFGPYDEQLQLKGVAEMIRADGAPIWALVEVVDAAHFQALLSRLSTITGEAWEGILANGASVVGGSAHYDVDEQKPALLWRSGTLSDVEADVILGQQDYAFAGRPPLRVRATVHVDEASSPITFVVLHLKANDAPASHQRRLNSAYALRDWLQMQPEDAEILVLGDWNDDLDVSISTPLDTPFRPLLQDPGLTFLTQRLTDEGISTTTRNGGEPIDHQLATHCLSERYVPGSVWVEKTWPEGYHFPSTISDHYPVSTELRFNADWAPCD